VTVFRRGTNVVSLNRKQDRRPIVNSLTLLGYGERQYQLVVTADAMVVNEDGETSRDVFGVRRGKTVSKDLKDLATAQAQVARQVEQVCWPTQTYTISVTDADAALCTPGLHHTPLTDDGRYAPPAGVSETDESDRRALRQQSGIPGETPTPN
jgi:hypothetical protein